MTEVFEFEEEATIEATFQIGVTAEDHGALYNRDAPNQHPISAITDLQTTLDGISGDISAETTRAEGAEGNLENLTTDDKNNLVSAINEVDSHTDTNASNLANHIANKSNPHEVTKAQLGLGNVDNTSDLDKPISTATQNALNLKVNTTDLGNAELDIQKNGTSVGKFTANASVDKVINLVIPTQASDVNALPDSTKYGASLSLTINSSTYVVTAQLKDQDGGNLGSAQTIDLPLESVVVNGSYDSVNKKIVLTLENGNTIDIPVGDLVAGLQSEITVDNKLASDLVDDTNQTNKFATSAQLSQIATNTSDISSLQSGKADKATTLAGYGITDAYTKTQVDTSLSGKANVGLDNLNASGQMVIDSQNGTISNCILEIPQEFKLELSGNTLTLKSGSTVVLVNKSTYTTQTTTQDYSVTVTDGDYRIVTFVGDALNIAPLLARTGSGSSLPADDTNYDYFFLIGSPSRYYRWSGSAWVYWNNSGSYPLAVVKAESGVASFAKDSNGYDMIFNGAGFIGHHAFVYPNVKELIPNGFNDNKSLKSILGLSNSLSIIEMSGTAPDGYDRYIYTTNGRGWSQFTANEVNDISELDSSNYSYVKNKNMFYHIVNNTPVAVPRFGLVKFIVSGTTVTDFTIRQPVRLATVEMLETKQADVTTLTGYDSTKTQTLKNVNGTLTWVDD